MSATATCSFKITSWDEKTYQEIEGAAKLTTVKVTQSYSGAIEGTSATDYLMAYAVSGVVHFVGLERISGTLEGKAGTFVVQHTGTYAEGKAQTTSIIVAGAGTGDLATLQGNGRYEASHSEEGHPMTFEYSFGS